MSVCELFSDKISFNDQANSSAIEDLLDQYGALLAEVDQWFDSCQKLHGDHISCCNGCSHCCRGLFDITLLDALYLKRGIKLLNPKEQSVIREKSLIRLHQIHSNFPDFIPPWFLNILPEEKWDEIMPEEDETPCVLISDNGHCLAYNHRPMTCRLNGIPLIDTSGEELFDDWCTMNFIDIDPREMTGLRHSFNDLFSRELLLFRELTHLIYGEKINEIDTIIPAAVFSD